MADAFPGAATIDPTTLDAPQWSQRDYYRVCVELIRRHATIAVFRDGWQFSIGCQVEVISALAIDIPVRDQRLDPVTSAIALTAVSEAAAKYATVGWVHPMIGNCVRALVELAG